VKASLPKREEELLILMSALKPFRKCLKFSIYASKERHRSISKNSKELMKK
jgi:hypothetical protein